MYLWFWRHLPGGTAVRVVLCALAVVAVLALLWFVAFPWLDERLPFGDVTVRGQRRGP